MYKEKNPYTENIRMSAIQHFNKRDSEKKNN